jgi:hypothetical protein
MSSASNFKTTHLIVLGWIEVEVPWHPSPTNFELKSDEIFNGLLGYHRMLK